MEADLSSFTALKQALLHTNGSLRVRVKDEFCERL